MVRISNKAMTRFVLVVVVVAALEGSQLRAKEVDLKLPDGFVAHRLYSVPKPTHGSWVSIALDPKGRLIASDQDGGLFRLTLPDVQADEAPKVEALQVSLGSAQGMLWAFDSLYVTVNGKAPGGQTSGLYRLRDTSGDDQFDQVQLLMPLEGKGEHGPHGLALTPDGKGIFIIAGNGTGIPKNLSHSRVPRVWADDQLLPRQHYRDVLPAHGGWVCRTDPEGAEWELLSVGLRNAYDIAVDRHGCLFTYDSDNERDVGQPWYRPTRVCFLARGGDYGWRSGSGKWPSYYGDSLPPVVEIGPGSPTGVAFGYDTHFPQKYREALFVLDWSFGLIRAVHLNPQGGGYTGRSEVFAAGQPLPVTDIATGKDGAFYFITGGRKTDSHLYRIRYQGGIDSCSVESIATEEAEEFDIRKDLETLQVNKGPEAIEKAWSYLGHEDRHIRFAARTAIEHQDAGLWRDRSLQETNASARITALIGLARTGRKSDGPAILDSLNAIDVGPLDEQRRLELYRAYQLAFTRTGRPNDNLAGKTRKRLDALYPADGFDQNRELSQLLVYLNSSSVLSKTIDLLTKGRTQEEQIHFAMVLRLVDQGWTPAQRETYFRWFNHATGSFEGGAGIIHKPEKSKLIFKQVLSQIRGEAIATLSEQERLELKEILEGGDAQYQTKRMAPASGGALVKHWKVADLLGDTSQMTRRNYVRGRSMFTAAKCSACHQFAGEGRPIGPDLSGVVARFTQRELLESIIEPSKVISDQFQQIIVALEDGRSVSGRVVEETDDVLRLQRDPLAPEKLISVSPREVLQRKASPVSSMPAELLDTLNKDEVLDLLAYLLSRGNADHPVY